MSGPRLARPLRVEVLRSAMVLVAGAWASSLAACGEHIQVIGEDLPVEPPPPVVEGPVATKVSPAGTNSHRDETQELLEPHVVGYISLDRTVSRELGPGQLATVRITESPRPLGHWLLERGERWLTARRGDVTGQRGEHLMANRPAPFQNFDSPAQQNAGRVVLQTDSVMRR